jgi:DnaJ-class molecular chaperone
MEGCEAAMRTYGVKDTLAACPTCAGKGILRTAKRADAEPVQCPRCQGTGRFPWLSMTGLDRKKCAKCADKCADGNPPAKSFVMDILSRASAEVLGKIH